MRLIKNHWLALIIALGLKPAEDFVVAIARIYLTMLAVTVGFIVWVVWLFTQSGA